MKQQGVYCICFYFSKCPLVSLLLDDLLALESIPLPDLLKVSQLIICKKKRTVLLDWVTTKEYHSRIRIAYMIYICSVIRFYLLTLVKHLLGSFDLYTNVHTGNVYDILKCTKIEWNILKKLTSGWTDKETRLLLELYREHERSFRDSQVKKQDVWKMIGQRMAQHGYTLNDSDYSKKWFNMQSRLVTETAVASLP